MEEAQDQESLRPNRNCFKQLIEVINRDNNAHRYFISADLLIVGLCVFAYILTIVATKTHFIGTDTSLYITRGIFIFTLLAGGFLYILSTYAMEDRLAKIEHDIHEINHDNNQE